MARATRPLRADRRLSRAYRDFLDGRPDVRVARLAAEEWSVLSLDELRACGLTIHAVGRRVRSGHLHAIHHCVYAVGHRTSRSRGSSSRQ